MNRTLSYSPFEYTKSQAEINKDKEKIANVQEMVKNYAKMNNYVLLKNDYFNMSQYYYDKVNRKLYEVVTTKPLNGHVSSLFKPIYEEHILKLNKII
jgi:hypothetical protein